MFTMYTSTRQRTFKNVLIRDSQGETKIRNGSKDVSASKYVIIMLASINSGSLLDG